MIKFLQENCAWAVPLLTVVSGIITGVFKLFQKNGKVHKQKVGDISNSHITNINGDVNK